MALVLKEGPGVVTPVSEEFAALSGPQAGRSPILLPDTHAGINAALDHLRGAREQTLVRITGAGVLGTQEAKAFESLIARAFTSQFSGMVLSGATRSVVLDSAAERCGVMEAGAKLESICPRARVLGVVPTQHLEERADGSVSLSRKRSREVALHPDHQLVLGTSERTSYLWDAEWRRCLELKQALNPQTSLLISYDGGVATEKEVVAWAEESRADTGTHIVLVRGGDADRATDRLTRRLALVRDHPNVHCVDFSAQQLHAIAAAIGILPDSAQGFDHLATRRIA